MIFRDMNLFVHGSNIIWIYFFYKLKKSYTTYYCDFHAQFSKYEIFIGGRSFFGCQLIGNK
jgi:hypothetical protein